jgi:hypothetical protein
MSECSIFLGCLVLISFCMALITIAMFDRNNLLEKKNRKK